MAGARSAVREWLASHREDRRGPTRGLRKSNRTDNESAMMATDKGVIQGYTGVAAVEAKHQTTVEALAALIADPDMRTRDEPLHAARSPESERPVVAILLRLQRPHQA